MRAVASLPNGLAVFRGDATAERGLEPKLEWGWSRGGAPCSDAGEVSGVGRFGRGLDMLDHRDMNLGPFIAVNREVDQRLPLRRATSREERYEGSLQ